MAPRARVAKNRARLARYEQMASQDSRQARRGGRPPDPARPAPGRPGGRGRGRQQGVRRPAAVRGHDLPPAARRDHRHHRPQRRGQDHALPHDRRPGDPRRRHAPGRRHGRRSPTSTRAARPSTPRTRSSRRSPAGSTRWSSASARCRRGPMSSWFNFKGPDQEKKVGNLSGGERNRVHLAKLLKSGGNLLLLDEPTNDLDVDTLRPSKRRSSTSAAARWSSATTAGSWTGSPRTSSPSRAIARSSGARATTRPTRTSGTSGSGWTPTSRTGSGTSR